MQNGLAAMSIDVEDWFQVENLRGAIPRDSWKTRTLRVERNMDRMLELMAETGASCTCFVLGWIAERRPSLVARTAEAGHEIASHGYGHDLIGTLAPEAFRADVERSKQILEDVSGVEVTGYRAPNFSITDWAIPILQEVGYTYDSSSFATIAHDRYGRLTGVGADASGARSSVWRRCSRTSSGRRCRGFSPAACAPLPDPRRRPPSGRVQDGEDRPMIGA